MLLATLTNCKEIISKTVKLVSKEGTLAFSNYCVCVSYRLAIFFETTLFC